jgi:hypothetical protein
MIGAGMSDILELWSEPWHALQRSLASRVASDPQNDGMHAHAPGPLVAAPVGGTWLVRARRLAASAASGRAKP